MSKTSGVTDSAAVVTVDFVDPENLAQNATTGMYTPSATAVASDVPGDLQPLRGGLQQHGSGVDAESDHIFFPLARVAGITEKHILVNGSDQYRITLIEDFGSPYPQQVRLQKITNP